MFTILLRGPVAASMGMKLVSVLSFTLVRTLPRFLLQSSASSFDFPEAPVNPVERRRAASLSVPQGVSVAGLPAFASHLLTTDCGPLPNYQNLPLPARSPPRASGFISNLSNSEMQNPLQQQPKIAFNQRSKHRDYFLVDYTAKETAQVRLSLTLWWLFLSPPHISSILLPRLSHLSYQITQNLPFFSLRTFFSVFVSIHSAHAGCPHFSSFMVSFHALIV